MKKRYWCKDRTCGDPECSTCYPGTDYRNDDAEDRADDDRERKDVFDF